ncbi:SecDF P1 head subdomain-containing protein [Actinoplanes ianthinogenes]|uniref:SecDF P1 head subdomain-containing protein n=1 Tax=Actinoplanes ianthinogenes TaxID=122358 RepID=UPI00166FAB83|nr:hypothetical protein [Actinoplanes ianthinogenes]
MVVLLGAAGTAIGLIGQIPVLALIGGVLTVVGVPGLVIAQRSTARSGPAAPRAARSGSSTFWVWGGVVVAVAVVAGLLIAHPWSDEDDQQVKPGAAKTPLDFYVVQEVTPGACTAETPGQQYTAADGSSCLKVSAAGGFSVRQLDQIRVQNDPDFGGWTVSVTFADQDGAHFSDLTAQVSAQPEPRNQLAIVMGSKMLSNPTVIERIPSGTAMIGGRMSQDEAQSLARELGAP